MDLARNAAGLAWHSKHGPDLTLEADLNRAGFAGGFNS